MNTIFALSLTASLIVLLLYPVFNALVSRCRAFTFNRISILVGIAIAVTAPILLPLVAIHSDLPTVSEVGNMTLSSVSVESYSKSETALSEATHSNQITLMLILSLYWIGVGVLMLREIVAYIRLALIIQKSDKTRKADYIICKHGDKRIAPFSWGKFICVADNEVETSILIHEKAHTEKRHWIDVAIADLFCIFLWYNPFAWMLKNLMKLNHEYDADSKVIEQDSDILGYQRLLIAKALGNRALPIANNFAMSKRDFRKRVLTMSKPKSPAGVRWIVTLAIPAIAIAVYANSTPFSSKIIDSFKDLKFEQTDSYDAQERSDDKVAETKTTQTPASTIIEKIPSPITDPEPLLKRFKISFETADKDLLPHKILANITADEDGNIVSVSTNYDDNPAVKVAVDNAINGLRLEVVKEDGRKIMTHFTIPISIQ